ncbi:MAG: nucleotidyltransferase domain-containing protein [Planctomycetota bacterium]
MTRSTTAPDCSARIVRAIAVGSLAYGSSTPASDADVIVVPREAEPRRMDRIPPLPALFGGSPLPLDLHPYTEREWRAAVARGDALARLAAGRGIDLPS